MPRLKAQRTNTANDLKLPACEKCRIRKIRCDGLAPKCSPCQRRNHACIISDPSTQKRYSRQSLQELADRLQELERQLDHGGQLISSRAFPGSTSSVESEGATVGTPFVGDGSGMSFLKHVFSSTKWTKARADLTRYLSLKQSIPDAIIGAYNLPSFDQASMLLDEYFSKNHVVHPFLDPDATKTSLHNIYSRANLSGTPQELYRIFMVLAIASVTKYRSGHLTDNPYGYFMAAQRHTNNVPMLGGIDGIQNLLLIARFAMYYYINCSIWDIARTCMRQCVELGLHRKAVKEDVSPSNQLSMRIFWDCYVHDRYSSATLGRPYAIDDKDVEVDPPDGDGLSQPSASSNRTPVTIFGFLVGLRRITSRMHTDFLSIRHQKPLLTPTSLTTAGHLSLNLQTYLSELQDWRAMAPSFTDAQSLFERAEWYDFIVEKDRLALIRGVMSQLLAAKINIPKHIYRLCSKCSSRVIDTYASMFRRAYITWTRSYFHIIFNAGLSIMYCLSSLNIGGVRDKQSDTSVIKQAEESLKSCKTVLSAFEREMPDTRAFVLVFEALRQRFSGGKSASQPNTRAETPVGPMFQTASSLELTQQNREGHLTEHLPPFAPQSNGAYPDSALNSGFVATAPFPDPNSRGGTATDVLIDGNNLESLHSEGLLETFPFDDFDVHDDTVFHNGMLEHMEAGLGQYAWGNLLESNSIWNQWSADGINAGADFVNDPFY